LAICGYKSLITALGTPLCRGLNTYELHLESSEADSHWPHVVAAATSQRVPGSSSRRRRSEYFVIGGAQLTSVKTAAELQAAACRRVCVCVCVCSKHTRKILIDCDVSAAQCDRTAPATKHNFSIESKIFCCSSPRPTESMSFRRKILATSLMLCDNFVALIC